LSGDVARETGEWWVKKRREERRKEEVKGSGDVEGGHELWQRGRDVLRMRKEGGGDHTARGGQSEAARRRAPCENWRLTRLIA
jgi:hypothetical protein